jgi:hypothetical protein
MHGFRCEILIPFLVVDRVLPELLLRLSFQLRLFSFSPGGVRSAPICCNQLLFSPVLCADTFSGGVSVVVVHSLLGSSLYSLIISFLICGGLIPPSCLLVFAITGFWKISAARFNVLDGLPINCGASMRDEDPVPCHFFLSIEVLLLLFPSIQFSSG